MVAVYSASAYVYVVCIWLVACKDNTTDQTCCAADQFINCAAVDELARRYFPWIFTAIYGNNSLFSVKNFVPPPIESDLGYRFRRRTLNPNTDPNPNPNSNPDPNPNPRTHPNPNPIFNRNWNKVFERKQKGEKRHRNIGKYSYISRLFCRAGGGVRKAPFPPPRSEDQLTI